MSEFPKVYPFPDHLPVISNFHPQAMGSDIVINAVPVSTAIPNSNPLLFPFRISRPFTITTFIAYNGATNAGNIDLGVYLPNGTLVISSGSTVQSGVNALQTISVAATTLPPGIYYLAIVTSSSSATLFAVSPTVDALRSMGVVQMNSMFPLASGTPATLTLARMPIIAITERSFV